MKNKIFIFIGFLIIILLIIYLWSFLGGISYKVGNQRGYSKSLIESKNRGVFVKELSYKFVPNQLKIQGFSVYIEKGFRYGENNIYETNNLEKDEYPYQLTFNYKKDIKELNDTVVSYQNDIYSLQGYQSLKAVNLEDTLILNITYYRDLFEVDSLGVIKVW